MENLLFGIENISFFDSYWAAVHFGSGLLTGIGILLIFHNKHKKISTKKYTQIGLGLLILWEYFELFLRYADRYNWYSKNFFASIVPESLFTIESLTNITSDLILGGFGLFLVYQYYIKSPKP